MFFRLAALTFKSIFDFDAAIVYQTTFGIFCACGDIFIKKQINFVVYSNIIVFIISNNRRRKVFSRFGDYLGLNKAKLA